MTPPGWRPATLMKTPLFSQSRSDADVSICDGVRNTYSLASTSSPRPRLARTSRMHLGARRPLGGWSRMERRVVVTHLAGSSILLIYSGSEDPQRNAAGRDGDLTGLIRPKISGQYGALRLGPGGSPRTVLSTIRVGVSTRGPNHLAPVAQTEEAAGPNPTCARSNRVGGTSPVTLGWLSARFVRGNAGVRHSPPALSRLKPWTTFEWWNGRHASRRSWCSRSFDGTK
jgi:hypothetical protein